MPPKGPVIRPVRAGDEIIVEVEGGFVRRPAPCDGLAVETADRELFLPAAAVTHAMKLLTKKDAAAK